MAYKNKSDKTTHQNDFIRNNYDRINLLLKKGRKEEIKSAASDAGQSVNEFINAAIDGHMCAGRGNGITNGNNNDISISRSLSHEDAQKITALLRDGQTIEEYCIAAVLDRIKADELKAQEDTNDYLAVARRLCSMSRDEQDEAMGLKKKR